MARVRGSQPTTTSNVRRHGVRLGCLTRSVRQRNRSSSLRTTWGATASEPRAGSISPRARVRRASAKRSASLRKFRTDCWATAQSWTALAERRSARRTTLAWVRSIRTTRLTTCVQGSGCASRCAAVPGTVYAVPALPGRAPEWHLGLVLPICSGGPCVRSGPIREPLYERATDSTPSALSSGPCWDEPHLAQEPRRLLGIATVSLGPREREIFLGPSDRHETVAPLLRH